MRYLILLIIYAAALQTGCYKHDVKSTPSHPWLEYPDRGLAAKQWITLDQSRIIPVAASAIHNASLKLADNAYMVITPEDVKLMTARSCPEKMRAYLVRGVRVANDSGRFELSQYDNYYRVQYECLSKSNPVFVKHPVIIFLERPPNKIYISISIVA